MSDAQGNYIKTWLYTASGVKAEIYRLLTTEEVNEARLVIEAYLADGWLANAPGLQPGESRETIVTVMRRAKPEDDTPIIDFYPEWGAPAGDEPYGTYKFVHKYLNNAEEIADFLAASGFKALEQIPLYDGQASLKRTHGKSHAKEMRVPTPFILVRVQGKEKTGSDGKLYKPWYLERYTALAGSPVANDQQPAKTPEKPPVAPKTSKPAGSAPKWWTAVCRDEQLLTAFQGDVETLKARLYPLLDAGALKASMNAKEALQAAQSALLADFALPDPNAPGDEIPF